MDLQDLTSALAAMTADDIHRVALALEAASTADEVDGWHATIAIDRALRHAHRSRQAGHAAWDAAQAVQRAAMSAGIPLPDPDVTHVARAAAEIARGMVAGEAVESEVHHLLLHWFPVLTAV
jgi:hypothetical protein